MWFDSGVSNLAVLTPENGLPWPSNMYLEGADQYRGWFHSSLLVGVALKGEAPYRECATNGWTLDEQGRAMSKSLGIGIHPDEIIPKYGADVLRLWAASVDFTEDVRLSDTILARLSEAYRKFRNTFKWALGNLSDFDPERDAVAAAEMEEIDRWILLRAEDMVAKCRAWYDEFAFHKVYRAVYDFVTAELSAIYIDASKDRLYTAAPKARPTPQRANSDLSRHVCTGSAGGAAAGLHDRRGLGLSREAVRSSGERALGHVSGSGGTHRGLQRGADESG